MRHQFSHYSLDISLALIELAQLTGTIADGDNYAWVDIDSLADYGLPTPVRKILTMLEEP
jgi:A/G-specific adenine glycosylase